MNLRARELVLEWSTIFFALHFWACLYLTTNCHAVDEWRVLERDDEAVTERIRLIEIAQQDVSIACYNTDAGSIANLMAATLARQTRAGVRVRLLIDGFPSRSMHDRLRELNELGIEVKVFHPVGTRPANLNRRLHSKIMVCDDTAMILGSRNLTDPHFGQAEESYIDCDYLVTGETCGQGRQYFEWIWNHPGALEIWKLSGSCPTVSREPDAVLLPPQRLEPAQRNSIEVSELGTLEPELSGNASSNQLTLVHDCDINKRQFSFEQKIEQAIRSSRCRILLETPYPAFSHRLKRSLVDAARRGVSVTIFTNSSAATDRVTTFAAFQNHKASLLRAGVELREFEGPGRIHAKGIIVDHEWAFVGSYNFDPRGDRLNLELCLQITDPKFVKAIELTMQRRNLNSRTVSQRESKILSPGTELPERLKIRSLQLLTPLLRRHL